MSSGILPSAPGKGITVHEYSVNSITKADSYLVKFFFYVRIESIKVFVHTFSYR